MSTMLEPGSSCLRWGNLTKEWHGKLPDKKTSSHLITGMFPSLFLRFSRATGKKKGGGKVEEGGNYATVVPG